MNKFQKRMRRHSYYLRNSLKHAIPPFWINPQSTIRQLDAAITTLSDEQQARLEYYCQQHQPFTLPTSAPAIQDIPSNRLHTYYFDFMNIARYFDRQYRVSPLFGDITYVPDCPSLCKSRPIHDNNDHSVLMKWDKLRHYYFVKKDRPFHEKIEKVVWRGKSMNKPNRMQLLADHFTNEYCDIGDTDTKRGDPAYRKNFMSIPEQLTFKYIISIEGIDVATNLKWIMSSNSLCFSSALKFETWFMEGRLEPNKHFVLLKDDYSDIEEKNSVLQCSSRCSADNHTTCP